MAYPITSHTYLRMTSTYSLKPQSPMGSPPSCMALRKLPGLTLLLNRSSPHFSKEKNIVRKSPSQNVKYITDAYTTSIASMFLLIMPYDYRPSKTTIISLPLDTLGEQKPLTSLDNTTSGLHCKRMSNDS
jgi:hypothetical protein